LTTPVSFNQEAGSICEQVKEQDAVRTRSYGSRIGSDNEGNPLQVNLVKVGEKATDLAILRDDRNINHRSRYQTCGDIGHDVRHIFSWSRRNDTMPLRRVRFYPNSLLK